jgi:two-component system LytT family response regulator
MKAIIIEDEFAAVENLTFYLSQIAPEIQVIEVIDTVSYAVEYLRKSQELDLMFIDIHLADGNSFEIFNHVTPSAPIIFTTAFDQYAIRAFKVNSIDYLLKPIQESQLARAIAKFKTTQSALRVSTSQVQNLMSLLQTPAPPRRQSFLVKKADSLIPVPVEDFAYFFIKNGIVRGTTHTNITYHIDGKLEYLEHELDPADFFRANRQFLIQRTPIAQLSMYFNGRLVIHANPKSEDKIVVSKPNAPKLKSWLSAS